MIPTDRTIVLLTLSAASYGLLLAFVVRELWRSRSPRNTPGDAPPGRLYSGIPRGWTTACGCKPSIRQYQAGASLLAYVLLSLLWTLGQLARGAESTPWLGPPGLLPRLLLYALIPLSLLFLDLTRRFLGQGAGRALRPALMWALGLVWLAIEVVLYEPTAISGQIATLFRFGPEYGRVASLWLAFGLLVAGWGCVLAATVVLTLQAYRREPLGSKEPTGSRGQRDRIAWWGVAVAMTAVGEGLFLAGYWGASSPNTVWAHLSSWGSLAHLLGSSITVSLLTIGRPADVRRLAWGTLGRLTVTLLMVLVYTGAFLVTCYACQSAPGYSLWLVALAVAVILAVAVHPLLDRAHHAVEQWFSRGHAGSSAETPTWGTTTSPATSTRGGTVTPRADPTAPGAVATQNTRQPDELQARCTESERRIRELAAANEALVRMDRNKTELLRDIALDLRRPGVAIEGYLALLHELARTNALTPTLREEMLQGIETAVRCLNESTQRLLDVSPVGTEARVSSVGTGSGIVLAMRPTSVVEVVEAAAAQWQEALRQRKLAFSMLGLADLPPILADAERLRQAFVELIQNAIKFTPDGGQIQVRGLYRDADRPDEEPKVEIVVADTGLGLARGDLERVFEPFYRVGDLRLDHSGQTRFQAAGLGLGLSMVRDVVRAHRGRVWATSPGRDPKGCPGTEVRMVLPAPAMSTSPNTAGSQ